MTSSASEEVLALPQTALNELSKFFALAADQPTSRMEMFSPAVDAVWHTLLERPVEYAEFCRAATGGARVDHDSAKGLGDISWIPDYESKYGPLNDVWFMDEHGRLDESLRSAYRGSGNVITAWDCNPAVVEEDAPDPEEGEGDPPVETSPKPE